jgi:Raf kinase inhibitor-like YbhB/YbcL family protein
MRLVSSAFSDGAMIPARFTCEGKDVSPPLEWDLAPSGTRSFILLCDDPDAPGGTWHHWAAYDIPPDQTALADGASQHAEQGGFIQGFNDFKRRGYGGPCPPRAHGPHRYHFRLLALPIDHLPVRKDASCREIEREGRKHLITEATLVGLYER